MATCYCTICSSKFDNLDEHIIIHDKAKELSERGKVLTFKPKRTPQRVSSLSLEDFKRHSDKFGNEMVLETAEKYLDDKQLADLKSYIGGSRFSGTTANRSHKRNFTTKRGPNLSRRLSRVS